ncbi:MAG: Abi family protein [Armatimonadetes bacterium]|nr:Abi family protein [Armatimonadota bacterium]
MPQPDPTSSAEDEIFSEIQQSISVYRLKPYRRKQENKKDALALYLWNMALCEALYPVLQCIEVALRNTIHDALSKARSQKWYDEAGFLLPVELERVASAKAELDRNRKPHDHCRVVAELTFGFWASLFAAPYEKSFFILVAPLAFARVPRKNRNRAFLSARIQEIRKIRNRVFHHEPIWNDDLMREYLDMMELLKWLSPAKERLLEGKCRFVEIHDGGWEAFREYVDWVFALEEEERVNLPKT